MSYSITFKRKRRRTPASPKLVFALVVSLLALAALVWGGMDLYLYVRYLMPHAHSNEVWGVQFGSSGNDVGEAITADRDGNVIVAGETDGGALFGSASQHTDAFVAKFSATGDLLWGHKFSSNGDETVGAVAADSVGNVYMVGGTEGSLFAPNVAPPDPDLPHHDAFVLKLAPNGRKIWGVQFGTPGDDSATGAVVDDRDHLFVCGDTEGNLFKQNAGPLPASSSDEPSTDVWVAKFDLNGSRIYATQFGSASDDNADAIAVDANDDAFVAGETYSLFRTSSGDRDAFIAKLNPRGTLKWGAQESVRQDSYPAGIACTSDGKAYLAADMVFGNGVLQGSPGVATFRGDGVELGRVMTASKINLDILSAVPDSTGGLTLAGSVTGYKIGQAGVGGTAFVNRYDTGGSHIWGRQLKGGRSALFDAVYAAPDGFVYATGKAEGPLFGPAGGDDDVVVAKYAPNGRGPHPPRNPAPIRAPKAVPVIVGHPS